MRIVRNWTHKNECKKTDRKLWTWKIKDLSFLFFSVALTCCLGCRQLMGLIYYGLSLSPENSYKMGYLVLFWLPTQIQSRKSKFRFNLWVLITEQPKVLNQRKIIYFSFHWEPEPWLHRILAYCEKAQVCWVRKSAHGSLFAKTQWDKTHRN